MAWSVDEVDSTTDLAVFQLAHHGLIAWARHLEEARSRVEAHCPAETYSQHQFFAVAFSGQHQRDQEEPRNQCPWQEVAHSMVVKRSKQEGLEAEGLYIPMKAAGGLEGRER